MFSFRRAFSVTRQQDRVLFSLVVIAVVVCFVVFVVVVCLRLLSPAYFYNDKWPKETQLFLIVVLVLLLKNCFPWSLSQTFTITAFPYRSDFFK